MKKVVSIWSQLQFLVVYKDFRTPQPLILLGLQKLTDYFSTHLLTVACDFCLTLTDAVEPGNTGFYGICCFYVGVSGGV